MLIHVEVSSCPETKRENVSKNRSAEKSACPWGKVVIQDHALSARN
jgi:hypothetical protein